MPQSSERQDGWYWVREGVGEPWVPAKWNYYRGAEGWDCGPRTRLQDYCFLEIGQSIPSPNESNEREPEPARPCPAPNCESPNGPAIATDGFYKGVRFCLCREFDKGPYAKGDTPKTAPTSPSTQIKEKKQ